jgi:hypothetical protein
MCIGRAAPEDAAMVDYTYVVLPLCALSLLGGCRCCLDAGGQTPTMLPLPPCCCLLPAACCLLPAACCLLAALCADRHYTYSTIVIAQSHLSNSELRYVERVIQHVQHSRLSNNARPPAMRNQYPRLSRACPVPGL